MPCGIRAHDFPEFAMSISGNVIHREVNNDTIAIALLKFLINHEACF